MLHESKAPLAMPKEIYLDNNATTKALPDVVRCVRSCLADNFGNPSSLHARGRAARRSLETARRTIASFLGSADDKIMFCSGATEANNTAINYHNAKSNAVIATEAEHPSIATTAASTSRIIKVGLDSDGVIELSTLQEALVSHPGALIALHWANGETGVLQPVKEICELAKMYGAATLFDAAQAIGRIPHSDLNVPYDYLSFSSHKLHGPQGVGALCLGGEAQVAPLIFGGGQERGLRSGTENLPGILGFAAACEDRRKKLEEHLAHLAQLRDHFETLLITKLPNIAINGDNAPRVPNTSNITFSGVDGHALAARLDAKGVICSQVSACSSARPEPSKTLLAMGLSEEDAFASLRFSFSVLNTIDEATEAAEIVASETEFLREVLGCVQ